MAYNTQNSGYLQNTITEIRTLTDSPTVRTKYTDTQLLEKIAEGYQAVRRDLHNSAQKKPLSKLDIVLVSGTEYYSLPPIVGEVVRFVQFGSDGITILDEWRPRHLRNMLGPGVFFDSNHRIWVPQKNIDATYTLFYYPTGDFIPHVGRIDKTTGSTTGFTMKTTSPALILGSVDRRSNAYVGGLIRGLYHEAPAQLPAGATQYPIWERAVQTYNQSTGAVTFQPALTFDLSSFSDAGSLYNVYEVVPADSAILWPCIAQYVARTLLMVEGKRQKAAGLQRLYDETKRAIMLDWSNAQTRLGQVFEVETVDDWNHMIIS